MSQLRVSGKGRKYFVELDGRDVSNALRGVSFDLEAGEPPRVLMDVVVYDMATNLEPKDIEVPLFTASLLESIGWTPPKSQATTSERVAGYFIDVTLADGEDAENLRVEMLDILQEFYRDDIVSVRHR